MLTRLASSLLALGVLAPSPVVAESGDRVFNVNPSNASDIMIQPPKAEQMGDMAIGQNSIANSIEVSAHVPGHSPAFAIGHGAKATSMRTLAFGLYAGASAPDASALGYWVRAEAEGAVAIGSQSRGVHKDAIALGRNSWTGRGAISDVDNPLAYGAGEKVSTTAGEVSIGGGPGGGVRRQITNLAAGTEDSDAATVSQVRNVKTVVDDNAVATAAALGGGASVGADGKITAPRYRIGGRTANTVGDALASIGSTVTDMDRGIRVNVGGAFKAPRAEKIGDIAIGQEAVANSVGPSGPHHAIAIGFGSQASAFRAIGMGLYASATALDASSFGYKAQGNAEGAMALGAQSIADAQDAVALGRFSVADRGVVTATENPLGYNDESPVTTARGAVSVGKSGEGRQIVNVAPGTEDTDAVNVSQVKLVKIVVDGNADATVAALGGGASVGAEGTIAPPTYTVAGATVDNVGDALTHLGTAIGDINKGVRIHIDNAFDAPVAGQFGDIAIGQKAAADSQEKTPRIPGHTAAIAIGYGARANSTRAMALGVNAFAADSESNAIGSGATAESDGALAIGTNAYAYTKDSVALGRRSWTERGAISNVLDPLAYGDDKTVSTTAGEVSVGGPASDPLRRQITNVAPGTEDSDAVTVSQVKGVKVVADSNATTTAAALGGGATVDEDGRIAPPAYTVVGSTVNNVGDAFARVDNRFTDVDESLAHTDTRLTHVDNRVAHVDGRVTYVDERVTRVDDRVTGIDDGIAQRIGNLGGQIDSGTIGNRFIRVNASADTAKGASAVEPNDIAIGEEAYANATLKDKGSAAIAIGAASSAKGGRAVALGHSASASASAENATSVGANAGASGAGAVSIGTWSVASTTDAVALGTSSVADRGPISRIINPLAYGVGNLVETTKGAVSVGVSTAQRQIINVAPGTADTDAANVRQVMNVRVVADSNALVTAAALGGGASVGDDGTITAPAYDFGGATFSDVGSAVASVDERLTTQIGRLTDQIGTIGLVQQDVKTGVLTVARDTDGDEVSFAGKGAKGAVIARKLTHVAPGAVSETSGDAINGAQFHAMSLGIANALGGGAFVGANGVLSGPTYLLGGQSFNNVGGALIHLDERVGKLEVADAGRATDVASRRVFRRTGKASRVGDTPQTAQVADGVTQRDNAAAGGDKAASSGESTVVAADNGAGAEQNPGSAAPQSDATPQAMAGTQDSNGANAWQLDQARAQVGQIQESVDNLQRQVNQRFDQMSDRMHRIGAMSAAMSNMLASVAGIQTDNSVGVGVGTYRGQTALAIGYQRKVAGRWAVTVGGSATGGSEFNIGAGAGYGW